MPTAADSPMLGRKVFITRTTNPFRDLFERFWDGDEWIWVNHGRPEGIPVVTAPGADMANQKLFVVIEDGRLFERIWTGQQWVWEDHGRPENVPIVQAPGAAMLNSKLFVVVRDGRLFERNWEGTRWAWQDHGRPDNVPIVHAPGAAMLNSKLFVVVQDGRLFERNWEGTRWAWQDHGRPDNVPIVHAPGAAMLNSKLFVVVQDGRLFERNWEGTRWAWQDHGRPENVPITQAPGAAMMNSKLFVVVGDGRLFERNWQGTRWAWQDHGRPPGTSIMTAPGGAMLDQKLFVGTTNQHMFERFWNGTQWVWVDHGTLLHDNSVTLLDNRSLTRRSKKTIAVVGDGFAEPDLNRYRSYVQSELMSGVMGRELFLQLQSAFNVVRIDLVSIESGVSRRVYDEHGTPNDPSDDTITSDTFRNTRLGYIFSGSWSHCWLEAVPSTESRLMKVVNRFVPNSDYILIVLNDPGYGGCGGGGRQLVSLGANRDVIYHEFGHGIGGLCDEYENAGQAFPDTSTGCANCSVSPDRENLIWADLVDTATPLPTSENSPPAGWNNNTSVGAFEGCGTFETGLFRPVISCRMRDNSPPFCPVCARVIRQILEPFL
jgi:photosystem II stability/assembly factor-like uncharacterized protein